MPLAQRSPERDHQQWPALARWRSAGIAHASRGVLSPRRQTYRILFENRRRKHRPKRAQDQPEETRAMLRPQSKTTTTRREPAELIADQFAAESHLQMDRMPFA